MKKRWVFGGAALALGLLTTIGAWPASAAAPTVTYSSPTEGESVKDAVVIHGDGHMPDNNDTVNSITVRLDNAAGHNLGPVPFGGAAFHWTPDVPWNGVYTAVARATGTDGPFDFDGPEMGPPASVTFKVERLPVAPSGVDTSVDETKRVVAVTWNANPEPDILGYLVFRGEKGIAYVRQGSGTKYDDALKDLPAGDYEYSVYAVREDANPDDSNALTSAPTKTSAKVNSAPTVALSGNSTATTAPKTTSGTSGSSGSRAPSGSGGRANLSSFSNLIDNSELPLARSAGGAEPDEGFDGELPFAAGSPAASVVSGEDAAEALNGEPLAASDDSRPESLLFLAAGLLVTVILMHVLWIKSEVDRVPLEPLTPEAAVKP